MDHRISKDMISSGMIPSGEKNQEDLGKTQYGTVPSPNALSDVYKKMYETKEEVINEHHKKDADGNTIPHEGDEINEAPFLAALAPMLGKVAAIAGKGAAAAGKGAATAAKVTTTGGKVVAGASKGTGTLAKAGNVLNKAADISLKTQIVGNMMPKPSMPAVEKKKSQGGMVSAGADLFDIVKGKLLDEGLSEEEIRDIMLTLTPDEIMSEMNAGPSTPVKNYGDSPDKPKILPNFGATRAKPRTTDKGTLIKGGKDTGKTAAQMSQEEYKNFDPKKPDPKQMAAQAKQEKNKQKFNDPMGVKNKNIGGQGLDPMDK